MENTDKAKAGIILLFGGVVAGAYLLAPRETSSVLRSLKKMLLSKSKNYPEVEDVEFVTIEDEETKQSENVIHAKKKPFLEKAIELL